MPIASLERERQRGGRDDAADPARGHAPAVAWRRGCGARARASRTSRSPRTSARRSSRCPEGWQYLGFIFARGARPDEVEQRAPRRHTPVSSFRSIELAGRRTRGPCLNRFGRDRSSHCRAAAAADCGTTNPASDDERDDQRRRSAARPSPAARRSVAPHACGPRPRTPTVDRHRETRTHLARVRLAPRCTTPSSFGPALPGDPVSRLIPAAGRSGAVCAGTSPGESRSASDRGDHLNHDVPPGLRTATAMPAFRLRARRDCKMSTNTVPFPEGTPIAFRQRRGQSPGGSDEIPPRLRAGCHHHARSRRSTARPGSANAG